MGQSKEKLGNDYIRTLVSAVVGEQLEVYLEENPKVARAVLEAVLRDIDAGRAGGVMFTADGWEQTCQNSLEFWYTQQYQVKLGDGSNLAYKVNAAAMAIRQLASYESGVLDASFTTWPDQVGYTPFGNADN